jgi:hypothetical protein
VSSKHNVQQSFAHAGNYSQWALTEFNNNNNNNTTLFTPHPKSLQIDPDISYVNILISKAYYTKFLGIYADSTLSWKIPTEQIKRKLSAACYAMGSVWPFMSQETLEDCLLYLFSSYYELQIHILGDLFT